MDGVTLSFDTDGLEADDLDGFFVGWPDPPTNVERLAILHAAQQVVIARDVKGRVIGFATAITDGCFAAYVPLLEVLPEHQGSGIGSFVVTTLLDRLHECYMIDLVCDDDVVPFYERLGGTRLNAVAWRNHDRLHHDG